ncbi:MAG: V-type ATP synthase subunit D [Planctomycetota bacterium]|nr:MAG: V-type ATP synthase subunit D [Planctomycetota bacterium]
MAKKIKTTRPELKRYRDALTRYERYLPMLKLKQQQLQITLREVDRKSREATASLRLAIREFKRYEAVMTDVAGVNVRKLAEPQEVKTSTTNIAGVNIPVFEDVTFPQISYSLFGTPPWVDRALADLREISHHQARINVLEEQHNLLHRELTKIIQRVNLFEKVKIPEAQEAIRIIHIKLGDEMTAAVGRAKIAKNKLATTQYAKYGDVSMITKQEDQGP